MIKFYENNDYDDEQSESYLGNSPLFAYGAFLANSSILSNNASVSSVRSAFECNKMNT
ncbi:MAG: hypothetical protein RSD40_00500 [Bacilli bacterium]